MRFLLIRHGEMTGDPMATPPPPVHGLLTENGCAQAARTAHALADIPVHAAFSSPYGRALETARIVLKNRAVPLNILECLKEWIPNPELDTLPSQKHEDIVALNDSLHPEETWKTELGEGCLEMCARVWPGVLDALRDYGIYHRMGGFVCENSVREHTLVFFAHGGSLNVLLGFILGLPPFPLSRFAFELTGVADVRFVEKQGIFYPQLSIPAP